MKYIESMSYEGMDYFSFRIILLTCIVESEL